MTTEQTVLDATDEELDELIALVSGVTSLKDIKMLIAWAGGETSLLASNTLSGARWLIEWVRQEPGFRDFEVQV